MREGLGGLLLVATLCALLLGTTFALTRERIDDNVARAANAAVYELLALDPQAPEVPQPRWRADAWTLCDGRTVLRRAAPGYAGPIEVLAVFAQGHERLLGVRVASHLETPGIADFLNDNGPDGWLASLAGRNAAMLDEVDTVTGATISSRAVRETLAALLGAFPDLEADCS